ncbi:MAG: T9SS type A sorting domain-containing protein [Bacteroidetes bacterium]|nr:T9SS type A sorting domain-containing protein [Bacteroidota bacterium]
MVRNLISTILFCFPFPVLYSQEFIHDPHAFGTNIAAGGIDQPRFQFVDIDGDNDQDLFILDRDERLWFYRSAGGTLKLEPETTFDLKAGSWFHFLDIDHDGDVDCFTNGSFSEVSLYTNTGTSSIPQFQLTSAALLDTSGIELFSERFSIPTFADIDGDGDDDFFSGGSIGSITFFKNIGTPNIPQFTFITSSFGGINIQGGPGSIHKAMHGASGIEFFDADSNGVLDLFWGDYFNPSLYFLYNKGTKQNANISLVDSTYPNEAVIQSYGFNIPQHVDIDADGAVDMMVGSVFPSTEVDNFFFYKNAGTNAVPLYVLQTKNFLPMIDAGSRSSVAAADFDGDGDVDLVIASAFGTVQIHDNTGTKSAPQFQAQPQSTIMLENNFYATVSAGDVNSDGTMDLMIGNFDGRISTFANTTTDGVISFAKILFPLDQYDAGQNSAPCIVDIDNNGTNDLLVGSSGGQVVLFKNSGTNASPIYTVDLSFTNIDVGNDAIPFTADIDNDGSLDLLIGNSDGILYHYRQSKSSSSTFEVVTDKFQNIALTTQASPCVIDIDNDGDNDIILGNGKGGIFYYRNAGTLSSPTTHRAAPSDLEVSYNYPNPFNPSTTIVFSLPEDGLVSIEIFDILGRSVETLTNGNMKSGKHSAMWNATNARTGTYFCHFVVNNKEGRREFTHRMSLIK